MKRSIASLVSALVLATSLAQAADPHSFTIAVLPDTQNYMDYTHQKAENFAFDASELFLGQMKFVAENLQSQGGDIAFVTSLGDVWQHQSLKIDPEHEARGFKAVPNAVLDAHFAPTPKVRSVEMPMAKRGFEMIAGKVPFSVVPGNHDYDAMWTHSVPEGGARFDPKDMTKLGMLHPGGLNNFRSVFGDQTPFFKDQSWYVASHDGGADSAQIFTAGGYRFLHIGLQFDPPNASLEWAASVLKRYAGLPTIISTHDYMDNAGQRLPNPIIDASAADPQDNSPQMVWDKLISQHDQIFLVLCGHEHGQAFRTDNNKFGHPVYQVLADYQDRGQTAKDAAVKSAYPVGIGDGWLRLMTFELGGAKPGIQVRTYSTHYKKHSTEAESYAQWYKAQEKPKLSDAEFLRQDEFRIELSDFQARFGKPAAVTAR
ncbi:serine/threonine protein phosphatase [Steroidobacter flavus]|uniref:Serine/threonine protein phosphatase n=1 Tax=Steroidobacter flavus TaxID=1842136 RepID=A0ABV8T0C1_9GAMM